MAARERDRGWAACTMADSSIPSYSSCEILLNQWAEIHLGCVALITQLCPKRDAHVSFTSKLYHVLAQGPQNPYSIYPNTTGHWHAKLECSQLRFLGHIDSPKRVSITRATRTTSLIQTEKSSRAGGIPEPGQTSCTTSIGDSTVLSFTAWAFKLY